MQLGVNGLEAARAWDPVAALLLCGPLQVRDLLVEGRRVVDDGEATGVDGQKIAEHAHKRVARLMS